MNFRMTGINTLLKRHGRNVTINIHTTGTYNPATGAVEGGGIVPTTVRGYFYDSSKNDVAETQIGQGRRRLVIKTVDTSGNPIPKPKTADEVLTGDRTSIHEVDEVVSGEKVLFYICRLRE